MQITESIVVEAPRQTIFDLYRDLTIWPHVLADVAAVEVLYDDGYNQEFTMTVARSGGPETVRGIRYCRSPHELEMCQFTTPPMLKRMSGRWTFEEIDEHRTRLNAERSFETLAQDGEDAFAETLRGHLQANLKSFSREASRVAAG